MVCTAHVVCRVAIDRLTINASEVDALFVDVCFRRRRYQATNATANHQHRCKESITALPADCYYAFSCN